MTRETCHKNLKIVQDWTIANWTRRENAQRDAIRWVQEEIEAIDRELSNLKNVWGVNERWTAEQTHRFNWLNRHKARVNDLRQVLDSATLAHEVFRAIQDWKVSYPEDEQMVLTLPVQYYPWSPTRANHVHQFIGRPSACACGARPTDIGLDKNFTDKTTQENNVNFTIRVIEVKAGWVGQIVGKAYSGAPKESIVWESESFTDDEDYEYDEDTETYKGKGGADKALKAAQERAEKALTDLFA